MSDDADAGCGCLLLPFILGFLAVVLTLAAKLCLVIWHW